MPERLTLNGFFEAVSNRPRDLVTKAFFIVAPTFVAMSYSEIKPKVHVSERCSQEPVLLL